MQTILPNAPPATSFAPRSLSGAEMICLAYFSYLAGLGIFRSASPLRMTVLAAIPFLLWSVWRIALFADHNGPQLIRNFTALALILPGYWLLGWFENFRVRLRPAHWMEWDRILLDSVGLRHAIEIAGPVVPCILESLYLILYAAPAAALVLMYVTDNGRGADKFLGVLFLGTFTAYAILPHTAVASPRCVFPSLDLPIYNGALRQVNTWILDNFDRSASAFPSGHVAVAFSAAFGLLAAIPERRWIVTIAFTNAMLVYIATIYGRYHYAADGLASILIVLIVSVISRVVKWP